MNFVFLPPADQELEEAIEYYNDQLQGLGDQFYQQFLTPSIILLRLLMHGGRSEKIPDG